MGFSKSGREPLESQPSQAVAKRDSGCLGEYGARMSVSISDEPCSSDILVKLARYFVGVLACNGANCHVVVVTQHLYRNLYDLYNLSGRINDEMARVLRDERCHYQVRSINLESRWQSKYRPLDKVGSRQSGFTINQWFSKL